MPAPKWKTAIPHGLPINARFCTGLHRNGARRHSGVDVAKPTTVLWNIRQNQGRSLIKMKVKGGGKGKIRWHETCYIFSASNQGFPDRTGVRFTMNSNAPSPACPALPVFIPEEAALRSASCRR
jgi:hypothetical protein